MFQTLLSNLQTLISSRFLVGSFFPTLAFWFANATMLFLFNAPFQEYVRSNIGQTAGLAAVIALAALIGVAFSAYAESALLPTFQSLMEGSWHWLPVAFFAPAQMRQYERLEREIAENLRLRGAFHTTAGGQTRAQAWQASLTTARQAGDGLPVNNFTNRAPSAREVTTLAWRRRRSRPISGTLINSSVTALVLDLRANNADLPGPDGDFALENTRQLLWDLIDYADQYAVSQYRSLVTKRQFSFVKPPLAPTRMGNVAKTVQGYAVNRYDLNFELLWSRLQLPAQKDKDFGPLLQSTKTQLDFLISCSALTFLWTLLWAVWFYVTSGPAKVFLGVALLGPLVAYVWYGAAVAQYRTFADVLRSSVDLFRFDLLATLHYPQPDGVKEERQLWQIVDALHLLYEVHDLRYAHSKS
jgi:hypothetical protein